MPLSVEDRLAIHDVIHLYAHLHDSRQGHRVASEIFTEDAVMDYGTGLIEGRVAIEAFFGGFPEILGTSHNITNIIVEGDGDRARAQSHCLAWHWFNRPQVDGRPSIHAADVLAVGGYDDALVRTPEGWRIARRDMVQYGTGLGVGIAPESLRPILEGGLGRLPRWP